MSNQVVDVIRQALPDSGVSRGLRCFCGKWFSCRSQFDEHLKQHPGKFDECGCWVRVGGSIQNGKVVIPRGSWTTDGTGIPALLDAEMATDGSGDAVAKGAWSVHEDRSGMCQASHWDRR
jgi:hypothetical protein